VLRGVFVTGTDTGVGKTVVSAALLRRFGGLGRLRYWKPIQTGIEQDDDTAEVMRLAGEGGGSPAVGVRLLPDDAAASSWIVEGAGGALVPLNESEMMTDLMTRLALPVVVAARSGLGTINHTLLTIEALRRRGLRVAGVVMVGEPNDENRKAIVRYGGVEVLGEMPPIAPLTPEHLDAWAAAGLDAAGRLRELLA